MNTISYSTNLSYSVSSCLSVLQMYLFVSMDSRLFVLCPNPLDIKKWVKGKMHPGILKIIVFVY